MIPLKQSTAATLMLGPFVDDTDGKTAETALTISQADVRLSKNGGNMAQKNEASACTHDEIGWYSCALDATDTNTLGRLDIMVAESGALPVFVRCEVMPANVWDSLYGADALQVHATEMSAGLITAAVVATDAIDADALAADAVAEINATVDTAISDAALATAAGLAALNNVSVADILTTQMTESYAAQGVEPTLAQALFWLVQHLDESSISGTTKTVKELDQSTTAGTLTLDDDTNPTSITRAT